MYHTRVYTKNTLYPSQHSSCHFMPVRFTLFFFVLDVGLMNPSTSHEWPHLKRSERSTAKRQRQASHFCTCIAPTFFFRRFCRSAKLWQFVLQLVLPGANLNPAARDMTYPEVGNQATTACHVLGTTWPCVRVDASVPKSEATRKKARDVLYIFSLRPSIWRTKKSKNSQLQYTNLSLSFSNFSLRSLVVRYVLKAFSLVAGALERSESTPTGTLKMELMQGLVKMAWGSTSVREVSNSGGATVLARETGASSSSGNFGGTSRVLDPERVASTKTGESNAIARSDIADTARFSETELDSGSIGTDGGHRSPRSSAAPVATVGRDKSGGARDIFNIPYTEQVWWSGFTTAQALKRRRIVPLKHCCGQSPEHVVC